MRLGRVTGTLWSTVKDPQLEGRRLVTVQPVRADGTEWGPLLVATDAVGANEGDLVYWARGKEASFAFRPDQTPTDVSIVGLIDRLNKTAGA